MQPAYEAVPKNTPVEVVQKEWAKGGEAPGEPVQSHVEPDDTTDHIHEVGRGELYLCWITTAAMIPG